MEIVGGKYSIKQIFLDNNNWQTFNNKFSPLIRPSVHDNVNKIFKCKTEQLGFHQYSCPVCNQTINVYHTCKSRFCSSCGKIAVDNWVQNSISKFPDVQYQHIIFTLPEQLRILCLLNRKLFLNALFKLATDTITSWAKKNKHCLPGIIAVLHTFGSSLEFNPHIHCIVSAGGLATDYSRWIPINFFPEKLLKELWKYNVISFMRSSAKKNLLLFTPPLQMFKSYPTFNSFLNMLYQKYIWYIHIGKKLDSLHFTIKYVGRYTKRPVIAETRISNYDGNSVSFWFEDKQLHKKVFITLTVEEFIKRIIRHIPDLHFKQIRYFGIFSNRTKTKLCNIVTDLINQTKICFIKTMSWRNRMFNQNGKDPLSCPNCNTAMILSMVVYPFPNQGAP